MTLPNCAARRERPLVGAHAFGNQAVGFEGDVCANFFGEVLGGTALPAHGSTLSG